MTQFLNAGCYMHRIVNVYVQKTVSTGVCLQLIEFKCALYLTVSGKTSLITYLQVHKHREMSQSVVACQWLELCVTNFPLPFKA